MIHVKVCKIADINKQLLKLIEENRDKKLLSDKYSRDMILKLAPTKNVYLKKEDINDTNNAINVIIVDREINYIKLYNLVSKLLNSNLYTYIITTRRSSKEIENVIRRLES